MTNKQYRVYIWIVTLLIEHPGITMDEIQKRWLKERQLSEGKLLHRRSFIRYCQEVKQLWGIEIVCNRHTDYCYFIRNEEIFNSDDIRNWMLTTLCVGMQVEDCLELNNRIVMEYVPSGQKWLLPLCRAMKENSRVEVTYKGYGCGKSWQATMSPYCVRLYQRHWYVLGKLDNEKLYTLSLDRVQQLRLTEESFVMDPNFDTKEYFKNMYGIVRAENSEMQHVVMRAFGDESCYLRDLPIHHSQKEVARGDGYVDFELYLHITKELSGFILSRGKRLKVISPKSYAKEIAAMK